MFRTLKMLVSVPVVMACALGGTVGLLKAIDKLPGNPKAERDCSAYDRASEGSADTGGDYEMRPDTIKDRMRREIVEKSIEILRGHGKRDEEIRSMLLHDFHIDEETLDELLNKDAE